MVVATATAASSAAPHNFAGTMALAVCALGLTAAVYVANSRRAAGAASPGERGKTDGAGAAPGAAGDDGAGPGGGSGTAGSGGATASAGAGAGRLLAGRTPQRNYYTIRAERHVRRHNASLAEWSDEQLGLTIPFSPLLFSVTREERQAPMVLLSLQYLRQQTHEVAVAVEELREPCSAEAYRDASLEKIMDCSKILASGSVRIGSTNYPQAEYCYANERDALVYVMAVFIVHERLALTVQYSAGSLVRFLLPTAFYELIRGLRFAAPRPSPSYLLVSEPRLGLGFRLSTDFVVHEGLAERLLCADAGSTGAAADSSPFASAVSRGARRMGLIASYEAPLPSLASTGAPADTAAEAVGTAWQQYLERQVQATTRRLGLRMEAPLRVVFRDAASGGKGPGTAGRPEEPLQPGQVAMRPYRLSMAPNGNFANPDDDDAAGAPVPALGSCSVQEVQLDHNSPCLQLVRGSLDELAEHEAADSRHAGAAQTVHAYMSTFYIPIRDQCVSFTFVAAASRHGFEEFVSWCSATLQSVSLRNHFGQTTSVLYCNLRHEILPFTMQLSPGTQTVEEPLLGDPLVVVDDYGLERTTVLLRVFPLLQVLPTSSSGSTTPARRAASEASTGSGAAGRGVAREHVQSRRRWQQKVLEHMLRGYLRELPERVRVVHWERCTVNAMPAMRFVFEQIARPQAVSVSGGAAEEIDTASVATTEWLASRSLVLEEEVGSLNPFSRYYAPPPPPLSYVGMRSPPPPSPAPPVKGSTAGGAPRRTNALLSAAAAPRGLALDGTRRDAQSAERRTPLSPAAAAGGDGRAGSRGSQSDGPAPEDPLRVGVAICAEAHVFLWTTSAAEYSLGAAQRTVQELASHFGLSAVSTA